MSKRIITKTLFVPIMALIIFATSGCGSKNGEATSTKKTLTTITKKVTQDDKSRVFKYSREISVSNVKTIEYLINPRHGFSRKEEYTYDKDDYITFTDNQKAYFLDGISSDSYQFKYLSDEEVKSIKGYHYVDFIINYNDGTKIYLGTTLIWKLDDKGETTSFEYARDYGCNLLKLVLEE